MSTYTDKGLPITSTELVEEFNLAVELNQIDQLYLVGDNVSIRQQPFSFTRGIIYCKSGTSTSLLRFASPRQKVLSIQTTISGEM